MNDLNSRQEAIDVLKRNYPSSCFEDLCKAVDIAIKALSEQPEIIRCKDCKHHRRLECPFGITVFDAPKDNEFCSRAERRTDG